MSVKKKLKGYPDYNFKYIPPPFKNPHQSSVNKTKLQNLKNGQLLLKVSMS